MVGFRMLYIVPFFPYPAYGGGRLRVSSLIARLSQRNEINLVSLALSPEDLSTASRRIAQEFCKTVQVVPHRRSKLMAALTAIVASQPYEISRTWNPEMQTRVQAALRRLQPDVVMCSRLAGAQYLPRDVGTLRILDQHDLSRYLWQTTMRGATQWWARLFSRLNLRVVAQYESAIYPRFDICISVSEQERNLTKAFVPANMQLLVVPNGVDTEYFQPQVSVPVEAKSLVLTGTMSERRNIDAAVWFCNEILPLLRDRFPSTIFRIVGRDPPPAVRRLGAQDGVIVTGSVPDVRPYLASAAAVVAPYRFGSGIKHKIPIAMSMGKPIVATRNACQGLAVQNNRHLLIADQPADFAAAVEQLLNSPRLCDELGTNARSLVLERYNWDNIVAGLEEAIAKSLHHYHH